MPKGTPSDIPHVQFSDHFIRVTSTELSSVPDSGGVLRDPHEAHREYSFGEQLLRQSVAHFDDLALQSSKIDSISRHFVEKNLVDAVAEFPNDWNGLDTVAQYYMARNDYAQASTTLEAMVTLRPKHQATRLTLARALALNGEKHRAKEILDTIPTELHFLTEYGNALAALGNELSSALLSQLTSFTSTSPVNEDAALTLANQAIKNGRILKARHILTKALDQDPLQFKVLFLAANLAFDERDYKLAADYLSRILDSNPSLDAARWLRSRCFRKLNRMDISIQDLEYIAHSQPKNDAILRDYFETLVRANRQGEVPERLDALRSKISDQMLQNLTDQFAPRR